MYTGSAFKSTHTSVGPLVESSSKFCSVFHIRLRQTTTSTVCTNTLYSNCVYWLRLPALRETQSLFPAFCKIYLTWLQEKAPILCHRTWPLCTLNSSGPFMNTRSFSDGKTHTSKSSWNNNDLLKIHNKLKNNSKQIPICHPTCVFRST